MEVVAISKLCQKIITGELYTFRTFFLSLKQLYTTLLYIWCNTGINISHLFKLWIFHTLSSWRFSNTAISETHNQNNSGFLYGGMTHGQCHFIWSYFCSCSFLKEFSLRCHSTLSTTESKLKEAKIHLFSKAFVRNTTLSQEHSTTILQHGKRVAKWGKEFLLRLQDF